MTTPKSPTPESPMTPDLPALEELAKAATPGPWGLRHGARDAYITIDGAPGADSVMAMDKIIYPKATDDAALIVAAVNALPVLIEMIRALEAERDAILTPDTTLRERVVRLCAYAAAVERSVAAGSWGKTADAILAIIPTSPPVGWRLVPVVMTEDMEGDADEAFWDAWEAARKANGEGRGVASAQFMPQVYAAMLAASPSPTLGVGERGWPTREEVASAIETVLFMRASTTDLDGYIIQTSRDCAEAALALFPPPPQTGAPA